jgi:predicted nucleic acid-binding protein
MSALYLDTSCLLKLFFPEPESVNVVDAIAREQQVVVSELARLEAETQLRARLLGGVLTQSRYRRLMTELDRMLKRDPFAPARFPDDGFERARRMSEGLKVHCRTLDLLHLAAMDAVGVRRLFTNDRGQAVVARALHFTVLEPDAGS